MATGDLCIEAKSAGRRKERNLSDQVGAPIPYCFGKDESQGVSMIDVSIVIVNWNTRQLLLDCIDSLFRETRDCTIEIIVVDNASTDGSPDAIRERFPEDVHLICNTENLGFARANNIGIRECKGRYVCLVNSDIIALDRCVDRMCAYLDEHCEIGSLAPRTINEHHQLRRNCREFPSLRNTFCQALFLDRIFPRSRLFRGRILIDYDLDRVRDVEVLSGCFLMVRREALDQVGLLDETFFIYGEDVDWGRRFHDAGWKTVLYPKARAIHIGGASSKKANLRFLREKMKADYQYWKKHHHPLARKLYVLIITFHYSIRTIGWALMYVLKKTNRSHSLDKLKACAAQAQWHLLNMGRKKVF
ncbi:MAG: glycosyltransferase family 2 protein [Planctomycetota bacterium]